MRKIVATILCCSMVALNCGRGFGLRLVMMYGRPMGMLMRSLSIASLIVLLQVCPIRAQQEQNEETNPQRRSRIVQVANVLLGAGIVFTTLEHLHQRESCVPTIGTCSQMRRSSYVWAAGISYSASALGYGIALGNQRKSVRIGPGGIAAKFAW